MVMAPPRARRFVVAELEGSLLRSADTFPYFMLVAFEASGVPRFAALLALWPLLRLLELLGRGDLSLRLAAFVATAGVPRSEIEAVSRAVLPKFMADDVDAAAWEAFAGCEGTRVVVTRMPRVMAERFAKEHLGAHEVVGCELEYSRLKRSTGVVSGGDGDAVADRVRALFADSDRPDLGIGRSAGSEVARAFLPLCREQLHPPFTAADTTTAPPFRPVIFHDGRLVCRPTPFMSLVILVWLPLGVLVAFVRIAVGLMAMDPIFFFMNPRPVYEVTFLNQLPAEATCAAGKSPVDVANYVQRILAATLGFECTSLTRKDKYRVLAGNDGIVNAKPPQAAEPAWQRRAKEVLRFLLH
ncbi:hypothetical protein EJB05_35828 [Eragrostis curvula]|uniref:Glycerol-3-phosphate acyltransferase RAM2/GPAT1-8 HAD-like domain-containing protein n=1 Tax=Eragrostis curvula TaxID=38414 RepID=A0A5J9U7R8_9POAL|nr:hypothetical protein EJB05_35828 [Eragrostis curvula]